MTRRPLPSDLRLLTADLRLPTSVLA
jgi:hypothetical protein